MTSTYPRWQNDPEPGFVHELSKRLADRFDVVVLAPHAWGAKTREVMDGVTIHRFRYAPSRLETLVNDGGIVSNLKRQPWKWLLVPLFITAQFMATWRQVRRCRPDVIHAHWLVPQGLLAVVLHRLAGGKAPVVITSHGADLFALRGNFLVAIKRFVIRRATAVTVVSNGMCDEMKKLGADMSKVSVRPMGVDLSSRFTPDPGTLRSRSELLFVGRLVEKKGLRHLVSAMPTILNSCPDVSLKVVGFGPEEKALRIQTAELGLQDKVTFSGPVAQDELPVLYRGAALFVAPFVEAESGDQEGLGLVVVEAIGCGCPVLVGNVPAARDLPVDSIEVSDHAAFAGKIIHIIQNPEAVRTEALKKRQLCLSQFDWNAVAYGYGEFFSQLSSLSF